MGKRTAMAGVLMLVMVSPFLAGCLGGSGSVQEAADSVQPTARLTMKTDGVTGATAAATRAPLEKNIENAQVGKPYEISYLSARYEVTLEKTAFETSGYGGKRYLMAFFKIRNTGEGSEFLAPDIYAVDATSEKYDKTFAIGLPPEYDKMLDFIKKLTPGTQTSGWVAIEVPEDAGKVDLFFEYTNTFLDKKPRYIKYAVNE